MVNSKAKSSALSLPEGEGPAANKQCSPSLPSISHDSLFYLPVTYFVFSLCIGCFTYVVYMLLLLFLML